MCKCEMKKTLKRIENKLDFLIKKEIEMANTLDDVLNDVENESTVEDSLITLLQGVKAQLDAAKGDQTKIDAIFTGLEANKAKLAAALTANTPAA